MRNRRYPRYPDDNDYTTNSPSYYDDLARKQKLIQMLAKKIWEYEETLDLTLEEISERLESYIDENDQLLKDRLDEWDLNLEKFPENVELLLQEWLTDGTLDHIINDTIFNWKADKKYVDSEIERLDEEVNKKADQDDTELIEKEMKQLDFVEMLKPYSNYEDMTIRTLYGTNLIVNLFKDNKQITHRVQRNNDDYFVHSRTWVSDQVDYAKQPAEFIPNDTVTLRNFFNEPSDTVAGYSLNAGEMEFTFTNDYEDGSLFVRLQHDNRGGVWQFTNDISGETVDISTWASSSGIQDREIFETLPLGNQTVSAVFIGDDPNNPPSSGEGTSRGWLSSLNQKWFSINKPFPVLRMEDEELIKPVSNVEFAINFKPSEDSDFYMVPFHGEPTAFERHPLRVFDGNEEIDIYDLGFYEVKDKLIIRQDVFGRHPSTPNIDQMIIQTDHIFDLDGTIKVNGKMRTLQPTYFNNSYVMMPVARADIFNRVLSSFNNEFPNTSDQWLSQTKRTRLEEEGDRATSYCFVSDSEPDKAIAYKVFNAKETYRQDKQDKDNHVDMTYIQHRNADLVKIYVRLFDSNANLKPTGTEYHFSGEYIFSNQHDISLLF